MVQSQPASLTQPFILYGDGKMVQADTRWMVMMSNTGTLAAYRLKSIGLVQRLAAAWRSCCSGQMNRVNSRSGSSLLQWQHRKHCHRCYYYYHIGICQSGYMYTVCQRVSIVMRWPLWTLSVTNGNMKWRSMARWAFSAGAETPGQVPKNQVGFIWWTCLKNPLKTHPKAYPRLIQFSFSVPLIRKYFITVKYLKHLNLWICSLGIFCKLESKWNIVESTDRFFS